MNFGISIGAVDMIISVGYRVKSERGVLFRIWANKVLKEYLLRGFVINQRFEKIEGDVWFLKNLGKKWFAFSKINLDAKEMINKIQLNTRYKKHVLRKQ